MALLPGCIDQGPDRAADDVRFQKESVPDTAPSLCDGSLPTDQRECLAPGAIRSCDDLGYFSSGVWATCQSDCSWDRSACLQADCGAPSIGGDLECDPSLPDPTSCLELRTEPHTGVLCTDQCQLEEVACPWCGDGIVNSTEACEPSLGPVPCDQIDGYFGDGEVACGRRCRFDFGELTRTCEPIRCGDGIVSDGEVCDVGPDVYLSIRSCPYGTPSCKVCTRNCTRLDVEPRYCGDGRVDLEFESECDDLARPNEWCRGRGAPPGSRCVDCTLVDGECWFSVEDDDAGAPSDVTPEPDAEAEAETVGAEPLDDADASGDPVADEPAGCGAGHGAAAQQLMYVVGALFGMGYRRRRIRAALRAR